ncbi:MAG: hypothetical protein AB7D51_16500 [Desulfovibrionaceae bacterium]
MDSKRVNGSSEWAHTIVLPNDFGPDIPVDGQLLAEDMHFNNATGMLTVEKVYDAQGGSRAYGVISAIGHSRERRAYTIEEHEERLTISNGAVTLEVGLDEMVELLAMAMAAEAPVQDEQSDFEHIRRRLAAND